MLRPLATINPKNVWRHLRQAPVNLVERSTAHLQGVLFGYSSSNAAQPLIFSPYSYAVLSELE